ncbi:MAG: FAD-binding protein [Tissierellia bacterium]|nr:FAD-binding protein [Tissierellia bacterium]
MKRETMMVENLEIDIFEYDTIIIGSGAASFNAADALYQGGKKDIAIVTDGLKRGTSRNTGSDKQTYYKQSTMAEDEDSPFQLARSLFDGGAMEGDIALVEGTLSLKCFYKLVDIGVPFPHDAFGQYIGYQTDHSTSKRATSVGPLTSKIMTEKLEEEVKKKEIPIFDKHPVIGLLKDESSNSCIGALAIDLTKGDQDHYGLVIFKGNHVILGTGGPACVYYHSVYPKSQWGGTGMALEIGADAKNLTEWQYGIASTKFRWNLSGTYQQVLPRYVSTDKNGKDEREFLEDHYEDKSKLLEAIFLKGYQWPFDPRKLDGNSSMIDYLIYQETQIKGRRVFLDFTKNPECADDQGKLNHNLLTPVVRQYLENSQVTGSQPFERLQEMNPLALELYKNHGIDLTKELLEIEICAQHHNGGLAGNIWWESNIKNLFPVGEANGSLGIYRPGGSALNSTQVGSYRAAEYISNTETKAMDMDRFRKKVQRTVQKKIRQIQQITLGSKEEENLDQIREKAQREMSRCGAFIREDRQLKKTYTTLEKELHNLWDQAVVSGPKKIYRVFRLYDMLLTQMACLSAMIEYGRKKGGSRGSYLVVREDGEQKIHVHGQKVSYSLKNDLRNQICKTTIDDNGDGFTHHWKEIRPIPRTNPWFETGWKEYRNKEIFKGSGK